ncbi:MAG: T9SS type A sorting domain-containing protein [Bacteroidota bacterium]
MKMFFKIVIVVVILFLPGFTSQGQVLKFNKTYGEMTYNYGQRIIQANDEGYFILGNESGDIGNTNIHIIRTDSLGVILFEKTIGDASLYWANDFKRTSDNGFLIAGFTNKYPEKGYDVLLVKTDSNANVEWEKTYGGASWDIANAVIETKDSAYLIVGETYSYGPANENIYIIKTNYNGDTIWTRTFGGDSTDYAKAADVLFDSTYLIGATTNSFGFGNFDGYVLNLSTNGDTLWTQTYGQDKEDIINSIKQTPDSGFVFVGSTMSYNAIQHEYWLMKYNKSRNCIWQLPVPWNITSGDDVLYNITLDDSSRYILTGYTTSFGNGEKDLLFLILGENNDFKFSLTGGFSGNDEGLFSLQTKDKGYIMLGTTENGGTGNSNIYVIKIANDYSFSSTTEQVTDDEEMKSLNNNLSSNIYPNISNGIFNLQLSKEESMSKYELIVSDIMGNNILISEVYPNNYSPHIIDLTKYPAGLYFITVFNREHHYNYKVIKCNN